MTRDSSGTGKRVLALLTLVAVGATPTLRAATPEPLPPPPELLDGAGYPIDGPSLNLHYGAPTQARAGQGTGYSPIPAPHPTLPSGQGVPGQDVYDPYNTPVSSYLPPLPGQPTNEVGSPYAAPSPWQGSAAQGGISVPELNAPPMANLPPSPGHFANRPPLVISPPATNLPDEYFNLPFPVAEAGGIPGVLLPELNEDFYDPGMGQVTQRPIRLGMTPRQLEPFFDLAKGYEKSALVAREQNDGDRYRNDLKRAVDGYMEIIAMADAGHEAREEAWYGVARCEYRRENWWKAFDALERSFPGKYDKREVEGRIKLEMFIAERLWRLGHNTAPDAKKDGTTLTGYQAASRVYAAAIFNQPNAKEAPLALLRRGDAAAMEEDWEEAAKFYRTVIQYYPESEPAMQARSSLAEAVYRQEWPAGFPEAARNDLASVMTEVESTERRLSGPAEERRQRAVTLANTHEAEIKLRQAKDYMGKIRVKKSRDAAIFQLGEIVSHYPNTPQAREAADLLLEMGIDPPLILSDGTRYPIPSGGQSMLERVANQAGSGGGSAQVARQPDRREPVPGQNRQSFAPQPTVPAEPRTPRPQPRQGNFSPVPELGGDMPAPQTGGWPTPQVAASQRVGTWAGLGGFSPDPALSRPPLAQYPQLPPEQGGGFLPGYGYGPTLQTGTPGIGRGYPTQPQPQPRRVAPRPESIQVPGIAPVWE